MSTGTKSNSIEEAKSFEHTARTAAGGANFREVNKPFDFKRVATRYGLMAGVLMGAIQVLVLASTGNVEIGKGLYGMFAIAPFMYLGLRAYRTKLAGGEVVKNGLLFNFYLSAVAASVMAAMTLIGALIGVGTSDVGATFGMVAVFSFFLILIGIAFGMIIGFVLLQGMKDDVNADENIEKVEGHA